MIEEAMAAVSIAYVERNEKSRSNEDEDEYYEEDWKREEINYFNLSKNDCEYINFIKLVISEDSKY